MWRNSTFISPKIFEEVRKLGNRQSVLRVMYICISVSLLKGKKLAKMSSCPLRAMCAQFRERSTGGAPAPRAAVLIWEETSTSELAAKMFAEVKNKSDAASSAANNSKVGEQQRGKRLFLNWAFRRVDRDLKLSDLPVYQQQ